MVCFIEQLTWTIAVPYLDLTAVVMESDINKALGGSKLNVECWMLNIERWTVNGHGHSSLSQQTSVVRSEFLCVQHLVATCICLSSPRLLHTKMQYSQTPHLKATSSVQLRTSQLLLANSKVKEFGHSNFYQRLKVCIFTLCIFTNTKNNYLDKATIFYFLMKFCLTSLRIGEGCMCHIKGSFPCSSNGNCWVGRVLGIDEAWGSTISGCVRGFGVSERK